MKTSEDPADNAEFRKDFERYVWLIGATRSAWTDFWLVAAACVIGGLAVYFFSGEAWAVLCSTVLFAGLFARYARIISRLEGEMLYLHRKWIRRGWFFATDGRSVEALPHHVDELAALTPISPSGP